jgi:hypothetical protein
VKPAATSLAVVREAHTQARRVSHPTHTPGAKGGARSERGRAGGEGLVRSVHKDTAPERRGSLEPYADADAYAMGVDRLILGEDSSVPILGVDQQMLKDGVIDAAAEYQQKFGETAG